MDIKKTAYLLGLSGLIPFFAGTAGAWMLDIHHQPIAFKFSIIYGAMILSFLGALYWGQALGQDHPQSRWLVWSVVPFLGALALLAFPYIAALSGMMVLFLTCLFVDHIACRHGIMPPWMLKLRILLTSGVVLALLGVWLAAYQSHGVQFSAPLISV